MESCVGLRPGQSWCEEEENDGRHICCHIQNYKRRENSNRRVSPEKLTGFILIYSCVAERSQHPDSMLFHLARGYRVVELPAVRLGRVRPWALWTVLHHRLEGLPHLSQGCLLRHLLLRLFYTGSSPPHCGVPVSDHLQGVPLLLPPVRKRHPQQPAIHWKTSLHGEQSFPPVFMWSLGWWRQAPWYVQSVTELQNKTWPDLLLKANMPI